MSELEPCATCRFELKGKCRRNPPTSAANGYSGIFDGQGCGEWELNNAGKLAKRNTFAEALNEWDETRG